MIISPGHFMSAMGYVDRLRSQPKAASANCGRQTIDNSAAHDRAIELLDEYFATPIGWTIEGLSPDPRLDPIRDHPGWLALVEKCNRQ